MPLFMSKIIIEMMTRDGVTPIINAQIERAKELQKQYTQAARVARASNFAATGQWKLPNQGGSGGATGGRLGGVFANLQARATTGQLYGMAAPLLAATSVTAIAGKTFNALQEGAKFQIKALATASDIANRLNVSMFESKAIVKDSQNEIAKMARDLPGETQDYQTIFNALAPTTAGLFKGNRKGFTESTLKLTERLGVMNDVVKGDANDTGRAIAGLLAGTKTLGEITRIEGIGKNNLFVTTFRELAAKKGLDPNKIKTWSQKQRFEITQKAIEAAVPESTLSEYRNTADALAASIKDTIFSPISGIFGVLREVGGRNNRTALDAYKGLLQAIKGFGETAGNIAKQFGLVLDPMAGLIDILDLATDGLNRMNLNVSRFVKDGLGFSQSWGRTIGEGIGWAIGRVTALLADPRAWKTALTSFFSTLGFLKGLAEGVFWGLLRGLGEGLKSAWDGFSSWFVDTLKGLVSWLVDRAKSAVGLNGAPGTSGVANFLTSPLANAATAATQALPGVKPLMDIGSEVMKQVNGGNKTENKPTTNQVSVNVGGTNASPQEIAAAIGNLYAEYKLSTLTSVG